MILAADSQSACLINKPWPHSRHSFAANKKIHSSIVSVSAYVCGQDSEARHTTTDPTKILKLSNRQTSSRGPEY